MPRAASARKVRGHGVGQSRNRSPRRRPATSVGLRRRCRIVHVPATSNAVLRRQRLDQPAHPAVADDQHARRLTAPDRSSAGHRSGRAREEPRRAGASSPPATSRSLQHDRDVPPRRRLRHHPQRHALERRRAARIASRGSRAQVLADGAEIAMSRSTVTSANCRSAVDDRRRAGGRRRPSPRR